MNTTEALSRLTTLVEQMAVELGSMLEVLKTTHEIIATQQTRIEALEALFAEPMPDELPLPPEAA